MSEPMVAAVTQPETNLDRILENAALVLSTIEGLGGLINPGVVGGAMLASQVLGVLTAGVRAHERITGQPLDLALLHHIQPVE